MAKREIRCSAEKWQEFRESFNSHNELEERFNIKLVAVRKGRKIILIIECLENEYFDLMNKVGGCWGWRSVTE